MFENGAVMETYYKPEHLPQFPTIAEGNPKLAELFFAWYGEVFKPGALSAREKALIALAVAQVVQCPYCIDPHSEEPQESWEETATATQRRCVVLSRLRLSGSDL